MTSDEKQLLASFRAMDDRSKAMLLQFGRAQSKACPALPPRRLRLVVTSSIQHAAPSKRPKLYDSQQ